MTTPPAASATTARETLATEPRLEQPDAFYAALIEAHDGLEPAASRALDARLVLLLANHIGRHAVLCEAIAAARANLGLEPDARP